MKSNETCDQAGSTYFCTLNKNHDGNIHVATATDSLVVEVFETFEPKVYFKLSPGEKHEAR